MEVIKIDGTTQCIINCDNDGVHIEFTLNARNKSDKTVKILLPEETPKEFDYRLDIDREDCFRHVTTLLSFYTKRGIREMLHVRRQILRNTRKWEKQNAKLKNK